MSVVSSSAAFAPLRSLLLSLCVPALVLAAAPAQQIQYSSVHRQTERPLNQKATATEPRLKQKLALTRTGVSLVTADFDSDGTRDLVSGYNVGTAGVLLLQRGAAVAIAPGAVEHQMLAAGETIMPYAETAQAIDLPIHPDLLYTADLHGHGHFDLLTAAKGDRTAYLLAGDGRGGFGQPAPVALAGAVSSLSGWRGQDGKNLILAGVCGSAGCGLQVIDEQGATVAFVKTGAPVTAIESAGLNLTAYDDLVLLTSSAVLVVDGASLAAGQGSTPHIDTVPLSGAVAAATGMFAYDRRGYKQLAVLGADATLHVFTRPGGVDSSYSSDRRKAYALLAAAKPPTQPTPLAGIGWDEVETVHNVGPGGPALMLRGRFSGSGNDDLTVLASGQYINVAHPTESNGAIRKATPVVTVDSQNGPAVAALATRITADARLGIVTMGAGVHPLAITPPTPRKTINVTTTADLAATTQNVSVCNGTTAPGAGGAQCSLRAAISVVNTDSAGNGLGNTSGKIDTIKLPDGTYTLYTLNNSPGSSGTKDQYDSLDYHYDVDGAVNIVGTSQSGTIITASSAAGSNTPAIGYSGPPSTSPGNGIDSIFEENSYIYNTGAFDMFLSNLTIKNARNPNQLVAANGDTENAYGGALDFDCYGSAVLTLTNVTFAGNSILNGEGGALNVFNTNQGSATSLQGGVDLENTVLNNNYSGTSGGGLWVYDHIPVTINNSIITANSATKGNNTLGAEDSHQGSGGGGIFVSLTSGFNDLTINNSTISNNTSDGFGGGINFSSGATMTNTAIVGNSGPAFGAGISVAPQNSAIAMSEMTFTGNTINANQSRNQGGVSPGAPNGAGICFSPNTAGSSTNPSLRINYSRFHGNVGGTDNGVYLGCGTTSGIAATAVDLSNNWWGCNGAAAGAGCDLAGVQTGSSETLTLSPFTALTLTLSSTTPQINSAFMATGSLGQSSIGTKFTLAQDYAYELMPATISVSNLGTQSISGTTLSSNANANISYAAITDSGTTSTTGGGLASVTVDGCTIKDQGTLPTCNSSTVSNFTVTAPDLVVTSTHSGNFKAADTSDTYTLTVGNIGNAPTSGTVTLSDTLPSGFTATALSGTGWTCTLANVTCTRSDVLNSSVTYPAVTLTVSVSAADTGTYANVATVSGGGDGNANNNSGSDPTVVVGPPTIAESFSPASVATNTNSTLTFTLGNPSTNTVSLTGVAFTNILPSSLKLTGTASTTCSGGTTSGASGGSSITLSGATLASGATCVVTATVASATVGTYTDVSGTVSATNSNTGGSATATLSVKVTSTRLAYAAAPASATAGGNAGTVQVGVQDNAGNINTADNSTVITLNVTGPNGYAKSYTSTVSSGIATFNLTAAPLTAAGTYTYLAGTTGLTSATVTATVQPGPVSALVVSGYPISTSAQLAGSVTVQAADSYGNPNPGFTGTVTLTSSDSTATLSPTSYAYTASDAGSHSFSVTFNTAGTQTIRATSGSFTGAEQNIVVGDALWVLAATGQRTEITESGTGIVAATGTATTASPLGMLAIDNAGNVWSVASGVNSLAYTTYTGSGYQTSTGGGLNLPSALAIDGLGYVWLANSGSYTVSEFSPTGVAVSTAAGFSTTVGNSTAATSPVGVAIDISGSVWTVNANSSLVTRILGAAAPVVSPISLGVKNATQGTRP